MISKVRWDKSHPERLNNLSRRTSWGSAGTCIRLCPLPAPHLLPCVTHHLVYHLELRGLTLSVPSVLRFGSSQQPHRGHYPGSPILPLFPHPPPSVLPAVSIFAQDRGFTAAFHLVIGIGFPPVLHLKQMTIEIYLECKLESIITLIWLRHWGMCNYLMHI